MRARLTEAVSDVLFPKEGAMDELRKYTIIDLMEPYEVTDLLDYDKNLARELNYKGFKDNDQIVGFDSDYSRENFPGGDDLFDQIIQKASFTPDYKIKPYMPGGYTLEVGTIIDDIGKAHKIIYYYGGLVDGFIARKEWLESPKLTEGIGDVLKPKNEKDILNSLGEINYSDYWFTTLTSIVNVIKYVKNEKYLDNIDNNWLFTAALYIFDDDDSLILKTLLNVVDSYHNEHDIQSQNPRGYFASFIIKHPELFVNVPNNPPKQKDLDSLLKRSCQLGFLNVSKYAIDKGANVNHKDGFGSTPLYYAAKNEELDIVKLLVENGANVNEKNRDDMTAIMAVLTPSTIMNSSSSKTIDENIIWYLIEKGADVFVENKYSGTLFDLAIKYGKISSYLLDKFGKKIITENSLRLIINNGTLKLLKKVLELGEDPKKLRELVKKGYLDDKHKESKLRVINEFDKLTEGISDVLQPKEGALEELNKWSFENLMLNSAPKHSIEKEGTHEWLETNLNLAKELGYKGMSDVENVLGFEIDFTAEEFPGDYDLFIEIACPKIDIENIVYPDFSGGLKLYVGNYNGNKVIYYEGGTTNGYVSRKEWFKNSVTESIHSVLKPKTEEEIVKDFSSKILSLLKQNKSVSFYKEWGTSAHKFNVFQSTYLIDQSFKNSYEQHGEGLYIQLSIHASFAKANPLKNLFPYENIYHDSVIKYDIDKAQLEEAITKLVDDAYNDKLGDGFHLHYFENNNIKYFDEVNEDLYQDDEDRQNRLNMVFKPKPKEDIKNKLIDQILKNYDNVTAYCNNTTGRYKPWPMLSFGTGEQFMMHQFYKHKSGIYFHVDDNSTEYAKNKFYELNVAFTTIGKSTFKILSGDRMKQFLPSVIDDMFDDKLDMFMIRKFY